MRYLVHGGLGVNTGTYFIKVNPNFRDASRGEGAYDAECDNEISGRVVKK
jgi:hypothetical protein